MSTDPNTGADQPSGREPEDPPHPAWRWVGAAAIVAFVLFWIYIFAADPVTSATRFDDPDFSARAEAVCSRHQATIEELPNAATVDSLAARADLVDRGTTVVQAMLDDLIALDPPADTQFYDLWLGDFRVYIADRNAWAANLRRGDDSPFVVSEGTGGGRVTSLLRNFAEDNAMASCSPSLDV